MLLELRVLDFAVVEALSMEFGPGLTMLTGETGAGKSIIVDALTAALGARAGADVVRAGAQAARVEARLFLAPESPASRWLAGQGVLESEVVVAREIGADGRSRGWLNGRPVTAGMLRDLGELMVEVIGQHESQQLLRPQTHIDLLDASGGPPLLALRAEVAALAARLGALRTEQRSLLEGERERLRRIDLLRHQVRELDAAGLQPGEEEALAARRTRLAHAERLAGAVASAYAALYESEGGAAVDRLGRARAALREVAALDPALAAMADRIDAVAAQAAEIAHELADYREQIEHNPDELAAIEDRLALLENLRRKYGGGIEALLASRKEAAAELARLDAADGRLAEIELELARVERDLAARCSRLSEMRREAAGQLEAAVTRELQMLEMKRSRLAVAVTQQDDPQGLRVGDRLLALGPHGVDRVEFLLAANPGEGPRPLAKIASGGELARVMLALRHVLAATGGTPIMVCDEVDAGIGARTAGAVGTLLITAARSRQVLCVTHLAQLASLGDQHYQVVKEIVRGRTQVRVRRLEGKERVEEVARMLSGKLPTPIAREYAVELLGQARRKKVAGGAS
ncbi:MAG: DNA repair protein RecN [Armatimonadota bacterium]|nr:DNA repair protein RecN [Armatimonadota bacterium]MDR7519445.1 DNA repair protein RecN [Armatimonadota bacterium]MDR7549883.1 DNA repair protein RecN [Armatimonadota bacterium]